MVGVTLAVLVLNYKKLVVFIFPDSLSDPGTRVYQTPSPNT